MFNVHLMQLSFTLFSLIHLSTELNTDMKFAARDFYYLLAASGVPTITSSIFGHFNAIVLDV